MASTQLSEEEVMQVAEEVRERFLREHSESDQFAPRDLQRVRNDLEYVAKFTRQQSGNHNNTVNQMVEALKWRHKIGVNDINFEDIEDYLWRSGMAYNHGQDKKGNNMVILNIRLHKKDSKKALALQRWIAFCFEAHCRAYPKGRMCMVFDMTGCGLSHMDMELMRFVVNCFKIYFPDLLAVLLVYNMPWILQAAWKIVQSWLSERAAAKVKFVNNETIREYVSSEQLLVNFGGTDTWQFDYEREKGIMLNLVQEVLERERREEEGGGQPSEVHSSDIEQSQGGDSEEVEPGDERGDLRDGGRLVDPGELGEQRGPRNRGGKAPQQGEEGAEESRKVRFSSNLPPTRQSRYGPDDEKEEERRNMASPDTQQLLRGSASSHGFRRRQVHKLISLQTDARGQRSPGTTESNNSDEQRTPETALAFKHIQLSPPHELVFTGPRERELLCTLSLTNTSQEAALFKIKTTAPRRYKVRPNLALIQPAAMARVQVLLVPGATNGAVSDDKFLVQIFSFSESVPVPSQNQLLTFWRGLSDKDITEHRLHCRWERESAPPLLPQSSPATPPQLPSPPPVATSPEEKHTQRELRILGDKLDRLVKLNQDLSRRVHSLRNWIIILLILVVILLVRNTALLL